MKIAISGRSGCGNTTISSLVAEVLGLRIINYTFRTLAEELNMTFEKVREMAERDPSIDHTVDLRQVELAREGNCVLGSRLAVWLLKEADLRVYLEASLETRAARIQRREGGSFEEIKRKTIERDKLDHKRYLNLYKVDNNDYGFVDLIIDTQAKAPEDVSQIIVRAAKASLKNQDGTHKATTSS